MKPFPAFAPKRHSHAAVTSYPVVSYAKSISTPGPKDWKLHPLFVATVSDRISILASKYTSALRAAKKSDRMK
jgi:hypothetical protein